MIENIKNDVFKNYKNPKITPKHPKIKNSKTSKSHVRGPQIKKVQKTNYNQILKILRMTFSKKFKTKKSPKKQPKCKHNVRTPQIQKFTK